MSHDILCGEAELGVFCTCCLIRKVRADEREKAWQRVFYATGEPKGYMTCLDFSEVHDAILDLFPKRVTGGEQE